MISASTRECFPPDPTPLDGLRFLKRSVTQPSFTAGSLTTQRLGRLMVKSEAKQAQRTPYLHLWSLSHPPQLLMGHVFLVYSSTTNVAILASLDIPCKCWTPGDLWLSQCHPYMPPECFKIPLPKATPVSISCIVLIFALELSHGLCV